MKSHVQETRQSQQYRIRPAAEADYVQIKAINRRAWTGGITTTELLEQRHGILDGTSWTEQIVDDVAEHLALPSATTFVAVREGRVLGYAVAQIKRKEPSSEVGILSYNAVDPDHRGQGIGTALSKHATNYLKEQGARVLVVWTLESDEPARHIYKRLGFKELTRFVYYSMDCEE